MKLKFGLETKRYEIVTNLKISDNFIDGEFKELANRANLEGGFVKVNDNMVTIPRMFGGVFYLLDGDVIIDAFELEFHKHHNYNDTILSPIVTNQFENQYSDILHKLYQAAANHLGGLSVIKKVITLNSSSVWNDWYANPINYDIVSVTTLEDKIDKLIAVKFKK